jgi:RimJ/RimL family protein N-acetyltransferase
VHISDLKVSTFEAAVEKAIALSDDVRLVPIGDWVFGRLPLIADMAEWRQKNMQMFCAKFESTPAKTEEYLRSASVGQPNRILFHIFENDRMVGHLGLSKITESTAELDNVMRGVEVHTKALMERSINSLCQWAKDQLGLVSVDLQVVDINAKAIALYQRCGFSLKDSNALMATQVGDVTQFVVCKDVEATTSVRSLIMTKIL